MVAACPFPYPRGTPIRIYGMASELGRSGHEVHVVTYHLGKRDISGPFQIHRIPRVPTYRKLTPGPSLQKLLLVDALLVARLSRLLRRHDFDVIHAHHYEGLAAALLAAKNGYPPVVFDSHTLLESELPDYGRWLPAGGKKRLGRLIDARLPRRASAVIAVSEEIRDRLVNDHGCAPEKVVVVRSGVELGQFAFADDARHGRRHDSSTVLYTGNLARYQGIGLLLRALKSLLDRGRDVRLLIVSNSSLAPYDRLIDQLGVRAAVETVPSDFKSDVELMARADVAANPRPDSPGLPQKLLNYMAAGLPIVSAAGCAELISNGANALVVNSDDAHAFADALDRVLGDADLARSLGDAARETARKELSWSRTAEAALSVYERVLG